MHCIEGHTLVFVLFAAVLITLLFSKTFSLLVLLLIHIKMFISPQLIH